MAKIIHKSFIGLTPYLTPALVSYEVSIVDILEKIDCVIQWLQVL